MKLNIPKIIRPLDLAVYAEELNGAVCQVWVNPTRMLLDENAEIQFELADYIKRIESITRSDLNDQEKVQALKEEDRVGDNIMKRQYGWWANILSQSTDGATHWTAEGLKKLDEQDTALWQFLRHAAAEMIRNHREGIKKG